MVRTAFIRRASTTVASLMMACFGVTGMASAQTITNTGANSKNVITSTVKNSCTTTNNNNISVNQANDQTATTGDSNSSENTSVGLPWTGWNSYDPAVWQQDGQTYPAWMGGVTAWMTQRSGGEGWNSSNSNLSWAPSGTDWASWDPMVWQQNGQSFSNWFTGVQSYINSNSTGLLMSWTPDGASLVDPLGGATTGDATNNNSFALTVNIVNTAPVLQADGSCAAPAVTGGQGGGSYTPTPGMGGGYTPSSSYAPHYYGGTGSGSTRYYGPSYAAPAVKAASAPAAPVAPSTPVAPQSPAAPSAPAAPAGNSISNTGYNSQNTIDTSVSSRTNVTNNNNVSSYNMNSQSASSGNANSSENTSTGGAGSGNAANGNGGGADVGISN